jgi:hypothetical protein
MPICPLDPVDKGHIEKGVGEIQQKMKLQDKEEL